MIELTPENIEMLVYTFLDGYTSGLATGLCNFAGLSTDAAEDNAQAQANDMLNDKGIRAAIVHNVTARVLGEEGGEYMFPMTEGL